MTKRLPVLLLTLTAAALFAAGCGSDDSSDTTSGGGSDTDTTMSTSDTTDTMTSTDASTDTTDSSGGGSDSTDATAQTLELHNVPGELKFKETTLAAKAGKVTLKLTNDDQIPHNVAIKVDGKETAGELVTNGDVSQITVDLKAGTYEYYCVPHEGAGMKGELTVS